MEPIRQLFVVTATVGMLLSVPAIADWRDMLKQATDAITSGESAATTSSALSNDQVVAGLKEALRIGTETAISLLGKTGGYLDDPQVKIQLPESLQRVTSGLRTFGQGELVDEFERTLNRAAELAVAETTAIFSDTIQQMSLQDAQGILNGGESAATDYFRAKSSQRLEAAILPIVEQSTQQAGVTAAYKSLVGQVGALGSVVDTSALDLDRYVTTKALDGLFLKVAEQERLIRQDPVARTTDLLKTVFGGTGQ